MSGPTCSTAPIRLNRIFCRRWMSRTSPWPPDLSGPVEIELTIQRTGETVFAGQISTAQMKRPIGELVAYLGRENEFPHGVFLMTGTGLVPPDSYTLQAGDVVEITIERIGQLVNPVQ
ncbi:MAG: hypothetical protein HC875_23265 [Anaerolineales bacterium]|nr:hypothetical protein [Anaerolineales bacterium]